MFLPSNITLQFGDSGDFVTELQRRLAMVHCFNESMINGFYDGTTVNAVTLFQSQCGLRADGIAGPETLRRLNGSISGDTSTTTDEKKEEEAQASYAQQQQFLNAEIVIHNQQVEAQQAGWNESTPLMETPAPAYAPAAPEVAPSPTYATPDVALAQPSIDQQMRAADMATQQSYQPAAVPPPQQGSDALSMLINNPTPPAPQQAPPPMPAPVAASIPVPPPQPAPQPMAQPQPVPPQPAPAMDAAPQQAPNLLQRTLSAASAMVQKLASYFEAKLPPDTLQEVKEIGQMMARSGVKENPIPADPAARAPEQAPSRGPAQQQTQQR